MSLGNDLRSTVVHRIAVVGLALALALIPILGIYAPAQAAFDSIEVFSVDTAATASPVTAPIGGRPSVAVTSGDTLDVVVRVQISGATTLGSIVYEWDDSTPNPPPGGGVCVDVTDRTTPGIYQETLTGIPTAGLSTSRRHTLYVEAFETNDCSGTGSGTGAVLPSGFPEGSTTIYVAATAIAPNPDLAQSCGIDVILILDESGSIVGLGPEAANISLDVRSGARDLVLELQNTGTRLAVIEFNGRARRASIGGSTAFQTVNAAYVPLFDTYIQPDGNTAPSNTRYDPEDYFYPEYYTNWQSAFWRVIEIGGSEGYPPLVVFFSDGNPTAIGNTGVTVVGTDPDDEDTSLAAAIPNANTVRSNGSHVFFVAIPNPNVDIQTVVAVTGPDQYPVPDGSVGTADFTAGTAAEFAAGLKQLVTQLCGGTVDVFKYIDNTNTAAVGNPLAPGFDPNWQATTGWAIEGDPTLDVSGGPNDFIWTTPDDTADPADIVTTDTDAQGRARFSYLYQPAAPSSAQSSIVIEELPDAGAQTDEYYLNEITCSNTAGGVFTVSPTNEKEFTLAGIDQSRVARCEYFNTRTPELDLFCVPDADNVNQNFATVVAIVENIDATAQAANVSGTALFQVTLPIGDLNNDLYEFSNPLDYTGFTNVPDTVLVCVRANARLVDCLLLDAATQSIGQPLPAGGTIQARIQIDQVLPSAGPAQVQPTVNGALGTPTRFVGDSDTRVCAQTTPITLGRFAAGQGGGNTTFEWTTSTEVANAGFNLYSGDDPANLTQLNGEFLVSAVVDSMDPTDYSVSVPSGAIPSQTVYLEEVSVAGVAHLHGPYQVGETYGERMEPSPIDWATVSAGSNALEAQRAAQDSAAIAAVTAGVADASAAAAQTGPFVDQYSSVIEDRTSSGNGVLLPLLSSPQSAVEGADLAGVMLAELRTNQDGICRVTYEELSGSGVDLAGVRSRDLALFNRGEPQQIFVSSQWLFGPGAFLEFPCEAVDSRYTNENVYYLTLDSDSALRMAFDRRSPASDAVAPASYVESIHLEENTDIMRTPPYGEEGWFWSRLYWPGNAAIPRATTKSFTIDNLVSGDGPAVIDGEVWGSADRYCNPDHFFDVEVNGALALSDSFDGLTVHEFSVANANLQNGDNNVTLRLNQTCSGLRYDFLYLDDIDVSYPRAFSAHDGSLLTFTAAGQKFVVNGLSTDQVSVYRSDGNSVARVQSVKTPAGDGTYTAEFIGTEDGAPAQQFYVVTPDARITPAIAPAHEPGELIVDGPVDLLMISHPDFMIALEPLKSHREYQGFSVHMVSVEDVYQVYGDGIFGPEAIRDYIADAAAQMGVKYVLLGGGDTVDYLDYKDLGSVSFIPSYYEFYPSDGVFLSSPADPLLVDLDGNKTPDLGIGRLPFRTTGEAARLVQKYLDYDAKDYAQSAVFAADTVDSGRSLDFKVTNERFIGSLPDGWSYVTAYADDIGASAAHDVIVDAINGGVAWANFAGHSDEGFWGRPALLTTADVEALTNVGRPTIVSQWGCFTNSYANPSSNTMALQFLVGGNNGAAAVLGTTTRSNPTHMDLLNRFLAPYITQPGMTIGEALQRAKEDYRAAYPGANDVMTGMTILGDPTMMVQP